MPFGTSGVSRGWETHRSAGKSAFPLPVLLALHPITGNSRRGNSLTGTVLIYRLVCCCCGVEVYDGIFRHSGREAVSESGDVGPGLPPGRVHSSSSAAASLICFGAGVGLV